MDNAQTERLALLLEEMGEAQQAIGKMLRHGYEACHPDGGPTNKESLEDELGHVLLAIELMGKKHDVNVGAIRESKIIKRESVKKYLHFN